MNKLKKLFKWAWAIVAVCVAAFFATALTVYVKAEPESVSELLARDDGQPSVEQLCSMSGDLEKYPYVTKVYEYETNAERLNVTYFKKKYNVDMFFGVVDSAESSCNYFVELFVYSDIADKTLVKRLWNISVTEGEGLTLTKTDGFNIANSWIFDDLKKEFSRTPQYIATFARVTAKPEYRNNIEFENVDTPYK